MTIAGVDDLRGGRSCRWPEVDRAFIHLDLDRLEPWFVPPQYEEPSGLLPGEVKRCIGDVLRRFDLAGVTISEFYNADPAQDDVQAVRTVLDLLEPIRHHARIATAVPG